MEVSESWEWFCGGNYSATEFYAANSTINSTDNILGTPCVVNGLDVFPHFIFAVFALLLILFLSCCTKFKTVNPAHLLRFPGHAPRSVCLVVLFILLAGSLGEGILTDATFAQPTQPHLYLPQCCAIIALFVGLALYQHMEMWSASNLVWAVVIYWICALATQTIRMLSLEYLDKDSIEVARFDFTLALIIVYFLLILLDLNVIRARVSIDYLE